MNDYNDLQQGYNIPRDPKILIGGAVVGAIVIAVAVYLIVKSSKKVVECGDGDILCKNGGTPTGTKPNCSCNCLSGFIGKTCNKKSGGDGGGDGGGGGGDGGGGGGGGGDGGGGGGGGDGGGGGGKCVCGDANAACAGATGAGATGANVFGAGRIGQIDACDRGDWCTLFGSCNRGGGCCRLGEQGCKQCSKIIFDGGGGAGSSGESCSAHAKCRDGSDCPANRICPTAKCCIRDNMVVGITCPSDGQCKFGGCEFKAHPKCNSQAFGATFEGFDGNGWSFVKPGTGAKAGKFVPATFGTECGTWMNVRGCQQ